MKSSENIKKLKVWPLWISLAMAVTSILLLLLYLSRPIYSTDIWWHIALGKHMLDSGSLILNHSIFSWTPALSYHTYNAWLGQIFFYKVDDLAGVKGLLAVRFGVFSFFLILGWSYAVKRGVARHPLTWMIILVSLTLVLPSYAIKPGLLTLGFMTITVWLYFFIRTIGEPARYLVYLFPLLLVIWVNIHGGFFLVAPFFALIAIGELLNAKFSPKLSMAPRLRIHLFIALALCIVAIFITPYGYEMPVDIIKLVLGQDNYFIERISEYKPTYSLNGPPYYFIDYLIIAMIIFIFLLWQQLKNGKIDWVVILVFIAYCTLFIQMVRTAYFLGPIFLFIGIDMLANKKNSWAWPKSLLSSSIVTVVCFCIFFLVASRIISNNNCTKLTDLVSRIVDVSTYAVSVEADFISRNLRGKKIGNLYDDGGYLMYRLWPEKQSMIDSRSFPFESWINEYFEKFADAKNIAAFIQKYPADIWLIRHEKPRVFQWFFKSPDWELTFLGPNAGVFIPKASERIKAVIAPEVSGVHNFWGIVHALNSSLKMNNFDFSRKLYEASIKNLNQSCPMNKKFINEIAISIEGYEAFNTGDYKLAADLLGKKTTYVKTSLKAAVAYMKLAELKFNSGAYQDARNYIVKAFDYLPVKLMEDIYNMAVADWHYRKLYNDNILQINDELQWEKLIQLILDNKKLVAKETEIILGVAKAMEEGRYDGSATFITRRTD